MADLVLISPDIQLRDSILGTISSTHPGECRWIDSWEANLDEIVDASPSLIIAHLGRAHPASSFVLPLVETFATKSPPIPVIVVADEFDGPVFRDLFLNGVRECVTRPLDVGRIEFLIQTFLLSARSRQVRRHCPTPLERVMAHSNPVFQAVCQRATRVAAKDSPLMLTGETGVGKTFLARLIHDSSPRSAQPFVSVNCGAIPESLAESELFGHKKGAFTSASEDYEGRFAAAGSGTLLLDEIDTLSPAVQVKLLRVLDDRLYEPVGSTRSQQLRARLITATNRPMEEAVADGSFRRDLYYRLQVVELRIPPLRERRQEIRSLALDWMNRYCSKGGEAVPKVSAETWQLLEAYDWPGNIRELFNVLEHAVTFMEGRTLRPEDLPPALRRGPVRRIEEENRLARSVAGSRADNQAVLLNARRNGERGELLDILHNCGFNKSRAARTLGISRAALYKRLQVLGIGDSATA